MEAATLEQSSRDASPVFVAGGRHRSHAVRLAAATLGLLLAGWLTALAAGLIGFSPLPELTLPGDRRRPGPRGGPGTSTPAGHPARRRRPGVADRFVPGPGPRPAERKREFGRERPARCLRQRGGSR